MKFAEHTLQADGFEIRYFEAGDGPPLVWMHGAGGLRLMHAHELLSATHRVIAFELPGFGGSAPNERSQSMAELAATMRAAVAELGLERCGLWGQSFGGKLALWMAAQEPERFDALALIESESGDVDQGDDAGRAVRRPRDHHAAV